MSVYKSPILIRRPWWVRQLRWLLLAVLLLAFGWFILPWAFSLPPGLVEKATGSPVLVDRDGQSIRHLTFTDFTRSTPVTLDEIPRALIDCTLAAEDKRFYEHDGIDVIATIRSVRDFARHRKIVSGASTITQQLVKISSPPAPRDLASKFREAMIARRLEMSWPKRDILAAYFSRLDYGNLRISPTEAARFYFQKPLSDLSLGECALLSGLPQAPSRLNPLRHPDRAKIRRSTVLDRLARFGKYDSSAIALARSEAITLRPLPEKLTAPWLSRRPGASGKIRTTLDLALQNEIEQIVSEETAKLKASNLRHAAVVVIDNATGDILAMVSSADWSDVRGGQVHGALTPRSPGSTLKPFTYLLGFRHLQQLPATIIADVPLRLRTAQGLQLPENYDRKYRGPVTIRSALACSLNVPALREMEDLGGPEKLYDFLGKLGISTLTQPAHEYGLGLTLGNAPVRLLELSNAYATLARMGDFLPTRLFMEEEIPSAKNFIDPSDTLLISDILSDAEARAPAFSTGGSLDLPFRCAVKTGTSSDFRDNWCVGYTPEFTVGVWAGNFENQPMKSISGVSGAGPIFHRSLVRAHRDRPATWFSEPEGLTRVSVDPRTGKIAGSMSPISVVSEILPANRALPIATPADYDETGRALLAPLYWDWFNSPHNSRRNELALNESAENTIPLEIDRPRNNTTILLDPEIPGDNSQLKLLTNLPEFVIWTCPTLEITGTIARLNKGTHTLTATDTRDGTEHNVTIKVREL